MSQPWASYHQRLAGKDVLPARKRCRTDPNELTRKGGFALAARHRAKKTSIVANPEFLKP
jgi:hypothetical protein